jgi:phosphatidylserine decarboxylase
MRHQYIERRIGRPQTEKFYGDRVIRFLYSKAREDAPSMFRALTGARMSELLGFINYDAFLGSGASGVKAFLESCGVDLSECLDSPEELNCPRKVFERRIRYWERRPMPEDASAVVSPVDARVIPGSFSATSSLYIKGKFFDYEELLARDKAVWLDAFRDGDFAIFRLTPDKYHYNHVPVAGKVMDIYEIPGRYHSCNPDAVVAVVTPYSKNKRVVTIIDTDVPGGTMVGLVAMIEVAALMIGEIVQCYSEERYDSPIPAHCGMFLRKGAPKSLYRPGSSTDVLIFQKGRIGFSDDLVRNRSAQSIESRFTRGFGEPLVETDVRVRSIIGTAKSQ